MHGPGAHPMFRPVLWLIFLVCGTGVVAEEIETVRSWNHYRDLMISNGRSADEADARIARMLSSPGSMERSAGSDRIGVPAPSLRYGVCTSWCQ